jgi:succinoglycan biosynthesis transport protein ExoP
MLQIYKSPSVEVDENVPAPDSSPADQFFMALGFIRRHFLVILSLVPLAIGLAVVYLFVTPPLYKGVASILIDPQKLQVFKQSILQTPADLAMMDTQIEILKSDNFALSIIRKLDLTHDPEFVGSDGLIGATLRLLHMLRPNEMESESDRTLSALKAFAKRLTATRVGASYVIEIGFLSTDRDRAAKIANAVADAFSVDQLEAKYQTIGRATVWLQDRLTELHAQVAAAERAIVEYKVKNNIVELGLAFDAEGRISGGRLMHEQQLSELNTAVVKARADRAEVQARLDRVMQVVNRGNIDPATAEVATVADALHSDVINKLRGQYLELAQREALFVNRLGPNHLAVVNIRNQMREIRHSIFDELKRIAEGSKSEYDIAKARQSSLEESLAAAVAGSQTTSKAQIELRQLESAAQSYHTLYDNFQQRYNDSVQERSLPVGEARVITQATPPSQKSSPKSALILMLATAGGLAAGFGLALLREISDRVFRTGKQVEARLNVECVAIVPTAVVDTKPVRKVTKAPAIPVTTRIIAPNAGGGLLRHVVDTPLSAFAESIRAIKMRADSGGNAKSNKVIGITSSLPNEGKSTIAASLAQLSAHTGARVILVDCDLRKPSLSQQLVPDATAGLLDVVTDMVTLDEVIWSDPSSKLSFLPAGVKSRLFHTSEILASDGVKHFFNRLRESYDYVIVDLPPVIPVVDVRATTHILDAYVFVVEWGKTKIDVVEHALRSAHGVYDKLAGVVLNKVNLKRLNRYEGHSYYNYHQYYAHYGYTD